jgi:hypothetical protein
MSLVVSFKNSGEKRTLNARQTASYNQLFGKKQRETVKQDSFIHRIVLSNGRQICKTCSVKVFDGKKLAKSQKMTDENGNRIAYKHSANCEQKGKF